MRLVMISDTHNQHDKLTLPPGDVLVHAGDLTVRGSLGELGRAADWLRAQDFENVVVIGGNHDFALEHFMTEGEEGMLREKIFHGMHYLRDNGVEIGGKKFWGSPWTPWFNDWAFNGVAHQMKEKWANIPVGLDVLVTHGPPKGVRDWFSDEPIGCPALRNAVYTCQPKVHVFGHVHTGYGMIEQEGTKFVNAAVTRIANEGYEMARPALELEI